MTKLSLKAVGILAGLGIAATALPATAASAQHRAQDRAQAWQSINQRQHNLDARIDQGVRSGQLSRREATQLRAEFRNLVNLEARYRRGGLNNWERADLNNRFDRLSRQIRYERSDRDDRRR